MANDVKQNKKHRKRGGIPIALVILLMVIAIAVGGFVGFIIARRTAPVDDRLEKANERIIELENTLNLIGFPMDQDPENWVFDDSSQSNGTEDLAGATAEDDTAESELWTEDADLLMGELNADADPVVVAEFNGGQLLSTEVIPEFSDQLSSQIFEGYSAEEVADSVLQSVLTSMAGRKLALVKARELGLDQLTEDELKHLESEADKNYDEQVAYYTAFVSPQENMTQADYEAAARDYMSQTSNTTRESILEGLKEDLIVQKYRDHVVRDISVSDAEVQSHYDERLAEQKANFTEYPEDFEFAHIDGDTILYRLEGYRAVRNLQLTCDSEDADAWEELQAQLDALDPEANAEERKALEDKLEPYYNALEAKAAQIIEQHQKGQSFLSLMDQYGTDERMQDEPLRTEGYYISENSFLYSTEFVQGALILEQPGQVSTPLRSESGIHLVEYVGDVTPGEVPLADVYDAMKAEALKLRQDAFFDSQINAMLEEANVQYYPERMQ